METKTASQMAPEQGPDSKTESSGKTTNTTNGSGADPKNYHHSSHYLQTESIGWIYLLRKDKLVEVCHQNGISTEGATVDQLRRLLGELIRKKRERASSENLLRALEEEVLAEDRKPVNEGLVLPVPVKTPGHTTQNSPSDSEVMSTIRRWDLTYEGDEHLMEFIERLEELAECYNFSRSRLLFALLEILKGRALQWYRVKRNEIESWEIFKEQAIRFFLPKRHLAHLEEAIYHRKQGPREKAKDYIMTLQTLIRQHPELRKINHTDRIYDGLRCEYKLYVRRTDFRTVDELMELTDEYELLRREEAKQNKPQPSHYMGDTTIGATYEPHITCFRCKEQGHFRVQCTNNRRLFCSRCGNDGILSRDCPCRVSKQDIRGDGRYYLMIVVNDLPIRALVDTGSTLTYLGEKVRQHLERNHVRPRIQHRSVQLADGTCIEGVKVYPINVTFNGQSTRLLASALANLAEPVILGMDFLRRRQVELCVDGVRLNVSEPGCRNLSPPPLHAVVNRSFLSQHQESELESLLTNIKMAFNDIQGPCNAGCHTITMKHDRPIKQRYYPRNPAMQTIMNQEVDELLRMDRIEPSFSPYSSPVVLVRKKQGTWRMCIDFRQINAAAEPDAYPLPQINAILDQLREAKYISTIDLKNGYWQIPLDPRSRQYTAFTVPGRGLFQWKVMPFGLHSAPATFQRILDSIIGPELSPRVFAYLDDIIVLGRSFEEHIANLTTVFNRLLNANLQINFEKSDFVQTSLKYLGHVVCSEGIHTDPAKIEAIKEMAAPKTIRELRRVLGVASWYRRFVPDFSSLVEPMTRLLKKKIPWQWGTDQEIAFNSLKEKLTEAPILRCPDFEQPFFLQTDASGEGLGAVLFQRRNEEESVIAYASRTLNEVERKYSATEQECLAVLWGIRKMRPYLEGYHFTVITDHHSLKWLHSLQNPSGRLARWSLELQQYDFQIEYRRGKLNVVADALSRSPIPGKDKLPSLAAITDTKPSWYERKLMEVQKHGDKYPDFQIIEGRLFRHIPRKGIIAEYPQWKLCVPDNRKEHVLKETHDDAAAGHQGVYKTTRRAQQSYYWPGMARDIRKYVRSCTTCGLYKVEQSRKAGLMCTLNTSRPWEVVCADFIGPLPRSLKGNGWLLVITDKFSKWVELIPVRTATASAVVSALKERVIYRFGCPQLLISDNGSQFAGKVMNDFLKEIGVEHRFTAPYTPQENPTERVNRVVKTMIAQYIGENHRLWDHHLAEIAFAINTAKHETTKQSAAEILFGRNLVAPRQVRREGNVPYEIPQKTISEKEWLKIAETSAEASSKQKHYYDLRRREWFPKIGDQIYCRNHHLSSAVDHFAAKLAPKFSGPHKIVGKATNNILIVQMGKKRQNVHIQDVKPVHERSN